MSHQPQQLQLPERHLAARRPAAHHPSFSSTISAPLSPPRSRMKEPSPPVISNGATKAGYSARTANIQAPLPNSTHRKDASPGKMPTGCCNWVISS